MDEFLRSVQSRAYRIAHIATGNQQDALDLVQDAMFKLVEKYSDRSEPELAPLFYRILTSRINDWHRRNKVRNRFRRWLYDDPESNEDPIQTAEDEFGARPDRETETGQSMSKLEEALQTLPLRQKQAFLLRAWEGLDVKQTAVAMSCAEGSVKTHYSRAIHFLREQLAGHYS